MRSHNHTAPSRKRRDLRRLGAEIRNEARSERSIEEQIALLDQRPGNSARERARLAAATTPERKRPSRQKRAKSKAAA